MDPNYNAILLGKDPIENEILVNSLNTYINVDQYNGETEYRHQEGKAEPDLFIIHKQLAKGDGVTTCESIRKELNYSNASILMILDSDSVYHKIKCYEAGADDYIVQPYHPEELIRKVKRLSDSSLQKKNLSFLTEAATNDALDATKTAFEAMRATSDLGVVIKFMANCQASTSLEAIALQLCLATSSLDVTCIVQIHDNEAFHTFNQNNDVRQIEAQILQESKNKGRIVEEDNLIIINFELLSLLVTDMPTDKNLHGRIKDTLVHITGAAEIRIRSVMVNEILHAQGRETISVINLIRQVAADNHRHATQIMTNLTEKVEESAISLSLTEEQEDHFIHLSQNAHKELDTLYKGSEILESHFMRVILGVQKAIKMHEGNK